MESRTDGRAATVLLTLCVLAYAEAMALSFRRSPESASNACT